jgi:hypothetical protein
MRRLEPYQLGIATLLNELLKGSTIGQRSVRLLCNGIRCDSSGHAVAKLQDCFAACDRHRQLSRIERPLLNLRLGTGWPRVAVLTDFVFSAMVARSDDATTRWRRAIPENG